MDRNQAVGLVLIIAILLGYFTFFAPKPTPPAEKQNQTTTTAAQPNLSADSAAQMAGTDSGLAGFRPEFIKLENEDLELTISTLGGRLEAARLKKYKTYHGNALEVLSAKTSQMRWQLGPLKLDQLRFKAALTGKKLTLTSDGTPSAVLTYALDDKGYLVKTQAQLVGQPLQTAHLTWSQDLLNTEKDFAQSRQVATTNYLTVDEEFNHLSETSTDAQDEKIEEPVRWITHKTKFFSAGIINRGAGFTQVALGSKLDVADTVVLKSQLSALHWQSADLKGGLAAADLYLGPNDYKLLGKIAPDFEKNVYLGWPIIRWVNKYIVVNVFHWLQGAISNYGIIIVLLVLFIRVLLLPLGYRSYLSMAKMRVLKPELDEIKAKHGDDMTAVQQEQMKLYQQVGINPLSGCIPLLLQMPILLAMFNFFPNSIELRQEQLWWAEDLSAWDSVASLPFALPGYGSHVSLFTILMTISTLGVTYINSASSSVTGPMATLQYVMPVVFMFILNSLPAGLSFYYLVSNVVSIGQQYIIKATVNDASIRAKLEENKTKNATKKPGKFASRLQEALRQAEEMRKAQDVEKQLKQRPDGGKKGK